MGNRRALLPQILFHPRAYAILRFCPDFSFLSTIAVADDASLNPPRASLFLGASQNVRGTRAEKMGWRPRPVVLEEFVDEGATTALAKSAPSKN
jgi:hypothetical protein